MGNCVEVNKSDKSGQQSITRLDIQLQAVDEMIFALSHIQSTVVNESNPKASCRAKNSLALNYSN